MKRNKSVLTILITIVLLVLAGAAVYARPLYARYYETNYITSDYPGTVFDAGTPCCVLVGEHYYLSFSEETCGAAYDYVEIDYEAEVDGRGPQSGTVELSLGNNDDVQLYSVSDPRCVWLAVHETGWPHYHDVNEFEFIYVGAEEYCTPFEIDLTATWIEK